jgi:hypothetical protein
LPSDPADPSARSRRHAAERQEAHILLARIEGLAHRLIGLQHQLPGTATGVRKDGPQTFVPGDDVTERGPQRVTVQRAGQPHRERQVVGAVPLLEAVEERRHAVTLSKWRLTPGLAGAASAGARLL